MGRLKIRDTVVCEETILCMLPRISYLLLLKLCFSKQGLVPIPCKAQAFLILVAMKRLCFKETVVFDNKDMILASLR